MESLRQKALVRTNQVMIPYLIYRDPQSGAPEKVEFESLAHFFSLLARADMTPVVLLNPQGTGDGDTDAVRQLHAQGVLMQTIADQLIGSISDQSVPARLLLEQVHFLGELLVESWTAVTVADLQGAQDATNDGWKYLFSAQFDSTEKLYQQLVEATTTLQHIKLN
jgi:hypothetical protein